MTAECTTTGQDWNEKDNYRDKVCVFFRNRDWCRYWIVASSYYTVVSREYPLAVLVLMYAASLPPSLSLLSLSHWVSPASLSLTAHSSQLTAHSPLCCGRRFSSLQRLSVSAPSCWISRIWISPRYLMWPGRVSLSALCQIHHLVKFDALSTGEHSMTQLSPPLPSLALHQPRGEYYWSCRCSYCRQGDLKISSLHIVSETTTTLENNILTTLGETSQRFMGILKPSSLLLSRWREEGGDPTPHLRARIFFTLHTLHFTLHFSRNRGH